jgi:hypothetical protein
MNSYRSVLPISREPVPAAALRTAAAQARLAYRLAAAIMLINVALGLNAAIAAGYATANSVFMIDSALAIGLIDLRPVARTLTLIRAAIGVTGSVAFAMLLVVRGYESPAAAVAGAAPQLALAAALAVILAGQARPWRLALGSGVYVLGAAGAGLWAASLGVGTGQAGDGSQVVISGLLALAIAEMVAAVLIKRPARGNWLLGWAMILLIVASLCTMVWAAWLTGAGESTGKYLEIAVMAVAWATATAVVLVPRRAAPSRR